MNELYNIDTIISVEDFKRNRKEHLKKDALIKKRKRKEKIKTILGIALFFTLIVFGELAVIARVKELNQQKSANEPVIQIAQNK